MNLNAFSGMMGQGAIDLANTGQIRYINIPYRSFAAVLCKITALMGVLDLLSVNVFVAACLLPLFVLGVFLYCRLYKITALYGFRLFPVATVIVVLNALCAVCAVLLRHALLSIFF